MTVTFAFVKFLVKKCIVKIGKWKLVSSYAGLCTQSMSESATGRNGDRVLAEAFISLHLFAHLGGQTRITPKSNGTNNANREFANVLAQFVNVEKTYKRFLIM